MRASLEDNRFCLVEDTVRYPMTLICHEAPRLIQKATPFILVDIIENNAKASKKSDLDWAFTAPSKVCFFDLKACESA